MEKQLIVTINSFHVELEAVVILTEMVALARRDKAEKLLGNVSMKVLGRTESMLHSAVELLRVSDTEVKSVSESLDLEDPRQLPILPMPETLSWVEEIQTWTLKHYTH